jgi:hypothetical protein
LPLAYHLLPCVPDQDLVNRFISEVLAREAARRARAEVHVLMWVTRYGWDEQVGKDGTPYWVDRSGRQPKSYTTPKYTYKEHCRAKRIQKHVKVFLKRRAEERRLEAERKAALEEERKRKLQAEIEYGLKHTVRCTLRLASRPLATLAEKGVPPPLPPPLDPEQLLPKKCSLVRSYLAAGVWALLQSEDRQSLDVVVVFRLGDGGSVCDVRNTKGEKTSKVRRYTGALLQLHCSFVPCVYPRRAPV